MKVGVPDCVQTRLPARLQVVWFKRDLRTFDNEALFRACASGPTLCFYVVEPDYWQSKSTSNRQWLFVRESLEDLAKQLKKLGASLVVHQGTVVQSLEEFRRQYGSLTLHSHQETGNLWTFERDKTVARWCRAHQCNWHEYAQNGVSRPVSRRKSRFKDHWDQWAAASMFPTPSPSNFVAQDPGLLPAQWPMAVCSDPYPCAGRQPGGRAEGLAVLDSFLSHRGEAYRGSISSPLTAESGCSRLSAHIAYGCVSLREIAQRVAGAQAHASTAQWRHSLSAYYTRLWWHCYFIQTFENKPSIEDTPLLPEMALLNRPFDQAKFDAWRRGQTGWPLVDACMRYLHHHGWINFRMRAMLVSAATYSLSLPWRPVADWLAGLFVDFEPGIHYPQIQMQSGTAGGTVLRVYNPVTQATTLDAEGHFVKRWMPELRNVSQAWIFEPWKMTLNLRQQAGWTQDSFYPCPLVDFERVHKDAKAEITALRAAHQLTPAGGFKKRNTNHRVKRITAGMKETKKLADNAEQLDLF